MVVVGVFRAVSRIAGKSSTYEMDLVLDVSGQPRSPASHSSGRAALLG